LGLEGRDGRKRTSATIFRWPSRWTKSVVNSERNDRCLSWGEENGVLDLDGSNQRLVISKRMTFKKKTEIIDSKEGSEEFTVKS
jgi:hypothetical protein